MKTRIIAVAAALAMCIAAGACAPGTAPTPNFGDRAVARNGDLPADVRQFLDKRYECYQVITAERSQQLGCKQLPTDEAALEKRYPSNETVLRVLRFQRVTASN